MDIIQPIPNQTILVFGASGWIGSQVVNLLRNRQGHPITTNIIISNARIDNYGEVLTEFAKPNITHCLLAAGLTGRPNVDWCEDHKQEVIRVNVIAASLIADLCSRRNIHLTFLSTGCIYEYDQDHPCPSNSSAPLSPSAPSSVTTQGFTEDDEPNFHGSFYSSSKILVEKIVKTFPNVLVLRIRMPLSDDLHPRNFITKITRYAKVVNIPNSMTVLHDLLPLIPDMMAQRRTGLLNFVNPGAISHNQILDLYRTYIDPSFSYTNFTVEEQAKVIKAGRSNNCLDTTKLLSWYPNVPHINIAIVRLFERMPALPERQK